MRWDIPAPDRPLDDGVVRVRLPVVGDDAAIDGYAGSPGGLDGGWLPTDSSTMAAGLGQAVVSDWLAGWSGRPSRHGPGLVVTVGDAPQLVGAVGLGSRAPGTVELTYGIAPGWRRQGIAARAARLVSGWLVEARGVTAVELRIAERHLASQRVATAAGFRLAGTVETSVAATGERFQDLRFVFAGFAPS